MKKNEFFKYVWIAQEIAGIVFGAAAILVHWDFVQVVDKEAYVNLMLILLFITMMVNLMVFTGWTASDWDVFYSTNSRGTDETLENIVIIWFLSVVGYAVVGIPLIIYMIIVKLWELGGIAFGKLVTLSGMYVLELAFVLFVIAIITFLVWFIAKITSVFEFTIIKRNKNVGENNDG
jgi:hypothetical protein